MNKVKKLGAIILLVLAFGTANAGLSDVPVGYLPIVAWHYLRKPISTMLHIYNSDVLASVINKKAPIRERVEYKLADGRLSSYETKSELDYTKATNRLIAAALFGTSGFLAYLYYKNHPDAQLIKAIHYGMAGATVFSFTDSFYELYKCRNYKKHLKLKKKFNS